MKEVLAPLSVHNNLTIPTLFSWYCKIQSHTYILIKIIDTTSIFMEHSLQAPSQRRLNRHNQEYFNNYLSLSYYQTLESTNSYDFTNSTSLKLSSTSNNPIPISNIPTFAHHTVFLTPSSAFHCRSIQRLVFENHACSFRCNQTVSIQQVCPHDAFPIMSHSLGIEGEMRGKSRSVDNNRPSKFFRSNTSKVVFIVIAGKWE